MDERWREQYDEVREIFTKYPTFDREQRGNVAILKVNPEKVARLIQAYSEKELHVFHIKGQDRAVDLSLAVAYAETARNMLDVVVDAMMHNGLDDFEAQNSGSTLTGLVGPDSDIDMIFNLPDLASLSATGKLLNSKDWPKKSIWKQIIKPAHPKNIDFALSVPSEYLKQPGEKWIPQAHLNITVKRPWLI